MAPPVVIAGAGLHGAALAYYLTLRGVKPLLIDQHSVAAAASGKGGGFLARDWGSGPTTALHTVSFALHEELAKELGVESYRKIPVLSVQPGSRSRRTSDLCPWLDGDISDSSWMDQDGGAQVAPYELCTKLVDAAVANGAEMRIGKVEGVETEAEGEGSRVTGVKVDGESVPASSLVVTMGPWSALAQDWFDMPVPMTGIKSTSVVFRDDTTAVEPFALFCGEDNRFGTHLEVTRVGRARATPRTTKRASRRLGRSSSRRARRDAGVPAQLRRDLPLRHRRLRVRGRRASARRRVPAGRGACGPGASGGRDKVLHDDVQALPRHGACRRAGVHAPVPARRAATHGPRAQHPRRLHVGRPQLLGHLVGARLGQGHV